MKNITTKKQLQALGLHAQKGNGGFWIENSIGKVFLHTPATIIQIYQLFYNMGYQSGEENGAWNKQQEIKAVLGITE